MSALGVAFKPLADLDMSAIDTLLVFGDQHSFSEAQVAGFDGVKNVIATGAFMGPAWKASSVFLPGRLHWEKAGSFTNFEGVVQSIDRATKANGTCKSEGYYAMKLAEGFGQTLGFRSPQEVFGALVRDVPGFANMEWWALKPHGLKLGGA
jgi:predicted molibdopterin-dependent oxidoreductase YjgC